MQIIKCGSKKDWGKIVERLYSDNTAVLSSVQSILSEVKKSGDEALRQFTKRFDGIQLETFSVSEEEYLAAEALVSNELKAAIKEAAYNIKTFHKTQISQEEKVEVRRGIYCWRKSVAIDKVGLYIPGGTAPLFSTVLMLGIPAKLAGCKQIVLCTPCNKNGAVHPAVLYAANLVGIRTIFKVGGAQAVAALAYGTQTIPAVYKIFGPGNQYVTAAKQAVQMEGIAIDMPAGPSEVCVLADETAVPTFVAADLLSQAEHGVDSGVLLITTSSEVAHACLQEINIQLEKLPRKNIAKRGIEQSKIVVCTNLDEAIDLANEYAAEHLILSCAGADEVAERIINAGSVFIGNYSPESVGDYASGTNHTLPTNGFAKAYSGVSVDSFIKKITFQKLSKKGLSTIAQTVCVMAEAEGLQAHAEAVKLRLSEG